MTARILRAVRIWLKIFTVAVLIGILALLGMCWLFNSPPHGVHSATDWLRFVGDLFGAVWWIGALGLIGAIAGACKR